MPLGKNALLAIWKKALGKDQYCASNQAFAPRIQQTEDVPSEVTRKTSIINENKPCYPMIFRHVSKESSYSVILKVISGCDDCYNLCRVCPSGRPRKKFARKARLDKRTQKIEHRLLTSNHISALFACHNLDRCENAIVKVVF